MLVLALVLLTTMGIFVTTNTRTAHAVPAHPTHQTHQTHQTYSNHPTQAYHGALQFPASRTYACYLEGPQNPTTPACQAAVAAGGTQPLYDWFAVRRSDGAGRTSGFIPDGELCSGGNPQFAAYDAARADWPATYLKSGAPITFTFGAWVPHPGYFRFYITNSTYDPTKPLTWSELNPQPFLTVNPEPAVTNGVYSMPGTLPQVTGQQIIYVVWTRTDSTETFYGCSDVVFSDTGVFPTPTPLPLPTCKASVTISQTWPGGYMGSVAVTNTGTLTLTPWVISFTLPSGVTLVSGWNATVIQDTTSVVASAPSWDPALAPGATKTIGFVANGSSSPGPSSVLLDGVACT
jgi:chitin-binding protein